MAHSSSKIYVKSNIGLGTASPLEMLHVYNSSAVNVNGLFEVSSGINSPQLKFKSPTVTHTLGQETTVAGTILAGSTANSLCFFTGGAQSIHFGTNNTSRMQINSSGNITFSGTLTANGVIVGSAANTISGLSTIVNGSGTLTLPITTDTLVGRDTTDGLTNKTMNLSTTNTFSGFTSGSILFHNGTTIAQANSNFFWDNTNQKLNILAVDGITPEYQFQIDRCSGGAVAPIASAIRFNASRGTTLSKSPLQANDPIGSLDFGGWDTSILGEGARISAFAETSTWTGASHPTYLSFSAAASGSTTALERMRLSSNGLQLFTGLKIPQTSKTAAYTLTESDFVVITDATSATVPITLPLATTVPKIVYIIKRIDSVITNFVSYARSGSDLIDGATIRYLTGQYESIMLTNDGVSNWWRI